ncbi:kinase-like protein [Aspergillus ibericus CBS 121593]|uniref:Kinase-like protein n=1 Tax=Aspergillus ibericus CBS 121593 TaxID=1448316 RepID=A0A395HD29_9EURO|nr:kinase-like protein [Aspergillus ibericus CBS 121593]RAL04888.1 kinase-like protein [Aspergillus ibericus CBS 121593]
MFRLNLRRFNSWFKYPVESGIISRLCCSPARTIASSQSAPPRQSPLEYVKVDPLQIIEEDEVFYSRYQVVSKLGYGTSSTVFGYRFLIYYREQCYNTLKVCVRGQRPDREVAILEHLKESSDVHRKRLVRLVLDSFEIVGPRGKHVCLIYQPLGMSFSKFQDLLPNKKFPKDLSQRSIQLTLIALAFIHENNVVHTDISPNNILQGIEDTSILSRMEQDEVIRPITRKILADRIIYYSRPMPLCTGSPVLSDLGKARLGVGKHSGNIMPGIYHAPESIWDLVEGHHLFFTKQNGSLSDEQHLAEIVSLMGPPPPEFLKRNQKCSTCIPKQSFKNRELRFSGQDKILFLEFLRRIFRWLPDERPTAEELVYDAFLIQPIVASEG